MFTTGQFKSWPYRQGRNLTELVYLSKINKRWKLLFTKLCRWYLNIIWNDGSHESCLQPLNLNTSPWQLFPLVQGFKFKELFSFFSKEFFTVEIYRSIFAVASSANFYLRRLSVLSVFAFLNIENFLMHFLTYFNLLSLWMALYDLEK